MDHQAALDFTASLLKKMRLKLEILTPSSSLETLDQGLRKSLGMQTDYHNAVYTASLWTQPNTVYKVLDQFRCSYIYLLLPGNGIRVAIVGPYMTLDLTRAQIMEDAECMGIPMERLPDLQEFYASVPIFSDPSVIIAIVSTLAERLWGGADSFRLIDVSYDRPVLHSSGDNTFTVHEQSDIQQRMKRMEDRYAHENMLMEIVSKGLTHRAELMMSTISQLNFQQRSADPLRNGKNYCVICNTLLRKAAEQGGVHPLHLDEMSSQYARTIENATSTEAIHKLLGDMVRSYSRLVKTHAIRHYSAIVQKAVTHIEANLAGDLSLNSIAQLLQVTPGYLSTLFRKETGRTLTAYITSQRMKNALYLVRDTTLQVQTIAQLCGFSDPNYFTKQFKRCYGATPGLFRKERLWHAMPAE